MKSFNIVYKNNKFYDATTEERIYLKDGEQYLIAGDEQNFDNKDPLNLVPPQGTFLDSNTKLVQVTNIKNLSKHRLFLEAGTKLYFDFYLKILKSEKEKVRYRFMIELLEDLYLYTCLTWKAEALPELHECHCKVYEETTKNLDFFEPVYARSLNEALSKTSQYYFPNQKTPGGSVYINIKDTLGNKLEHLRKLKLPL